MGTRRKAEVDLEAPQLIRNPPFYTAEQKRKWQAYIDAVGQVGPSWAEKIRRTYLKYGKDDVRNVYLEICRSVRLEKDRRAQRAAREAAGVPNVQVEQHERRSVRFERDLLLNTIGIDQLSVPNSLHSGLSLASVHPSDQASHSSKSLAISEESLKQDQLDRQTSRRKPLAGARMSTEGGPTDDQRKTDMADYSDIPDDRSWFNPDPDARNGSPELPAPSRNVKARQVSQELEVPSTKASNWTAINRGSDAVSSSSSSSHIARQSLQPEKSLSDADLDALVYAGIPDEHHSIQFEPPDGFAIQAGQQQSNKKDNMAVDTSFGDLSNFELGCLNAQSTSLGVVEGQISAASKDQSEIARSLPAPHPAMQNTNSSSPYENGLAMPHKKNNPVVNHGTISPALLLSIPRNIPLPAKESFSAAEQGFHATREDRPQDEDERTKKQAITAQAPLASMPQIANDDASRQPRGEDEPPQAIGTGECVQPASKIKRAVPSDKSSAAQHVAFMFVGEDKTGENYNPEWVLVTKMDTGEGISHITQQGIMPSTRVDDFDLTKHLRASTQGDASQPGNVEQCDSSRPSEQRFLSQYEQSAEAIQATVGFTPPKQPVVNTSLIHKPDPTRTDNKEGSQGQMSHVKQELEAFNPRGLSGGSLAKAPTSPNSPAFVKPENSTLSHQPAVDLPLLNPTSQTPQALKALRLHVTVVQAFADMGWETVHDVWASGTGAEEIVTVIKDLETDGALKKGPAIGAVNTMTKVLKAYESTENAA